MGETRKKGNPQARTHTAHGRKTRLRVLKLQVDPDIPALFAFHAGMDEFHTVQPLSDGGIRESFVGFSFFQREQVFAEGTVDVAEDL